ncbi:MAG TPA: pitrilysin family protein, partial [Vicinamibacteria bacterium]|nr:pitrilysin family protein [Vicinamibacteria bacterium]
MRAAAAVLTLVLAASPAPAQTVDRSRPPSPEPPRPLQLPPVQALTLANGLPVHLVERREVPTVEVLLVVRSGAAADPLERTGLASATADMLDEGAGGRDALALADAIEFLGAEVRTGSSWDFSTVALSVPVARLEPALGLMADVALRPDFPAPELERLRRRALTALLQARAVPGQVASHALAQALFAQHRYGLPAGGTASSLAALKADDLRAFHNRHYQPGNAALVVVGAVGKEVAPLLEKAFGGWPRGAATAAPLTTPPQVKGRRIVLIDKPGAAQSLLRVGRVGPPRNTADYHALEVMNTLLGGSFTSRLNDNLREQHGYAYGAGSGFGYRLAGGTFQAAADVQTQSTAEALSEVLKELARIATPATAAEVDRARNYLALGYAEEFETYSLIASKVAEQVVYG